MPTTDTALLDFFDAIGKDRSAPEHWQHLANVERLRQRMAAFGHHRGDPVRAVQGYLGDRWSSLIMHLLSNGSLRFQELRRLIGVMAAEPDISQRQLALKLRRLERDGLLHRQVTGTNAARADYHLTQLGHEAYDQFDRLVRWSEDVNDEIRAARRAYDQSHPDAEAPHPLDD